jgi:hypothetical protein
MQYHYELIRNANILAGFTWASVITNLFVITLAHLIERPVILTPGIVHLLAVSCSTAFLKNSRDYCKTLKLALKQVAALTKTFKKTAIQPLC